MTPDEQTTLLDALLDGDINEADFLRLEAELSVDAEVRKAYYRRLEMDLLLEEVAAEEVHRLPPLAEPMLQRTSKRGLWWAGLLTAIAAGLVLFVTMFAGPADQNDRPQVAQTSQKNEPSATGFGVLSGQSDAVWEGEAIENGGLLPQGELHLVSGLVHVELFSGVQMVIRGEAMFSIDSPMQVSMRKGSARAHVPEPAHGFRLKTGAGEVVDLGTEFTVDVDETRSSVKVVDGEVELRTREAETWRLRDGEGVELAADGTLAKESADDIALIGPAAFQDVLAERQSDQFRRWQLATQLLRNDPRLMAHYLVDPTQGWSRTLVNRASAASRVNGTAIAGDGAVVAATRTQDRWGRDGGALDFSRMGSRVRVVVPGEHRGLTLMCWVKINSLDRWYNSLFLTDGHEDREPHWQLMNDGRMFFSVKPPDIDHLPPAERERQVFYSPPFWETSMSGQWIMLATVYDVDQKRVSHYVNGAPISHESIPETFLVESIKIGAASICNWSEPMYRSDATFVVRNLNGCVDEFALFSGALSHEEISNLYHAGNPNER
ncbi:FecR domain-containing protein [Stieleria sp. ICT_E10.1]|uniref:LamG-like jellyroll fold domain-containing protein n=1 Tax=Stieleria sedimenti TaxID=2976331 RepID=UPI0021807231|nr:LamG-like jellyroll fold domain-containing protein [Stieleria sedimenti]MCS7467615.1 FecR domain-containing protein [Stieleria sedimenti]